MISHREWNCKKCGECYLSYLKRIKLEHEQFLNDRPNRQTTEEWLAEYNAAKEEGMGLFLRARKRVSEAIKRKI